MSQTTGTYGTSNDKIAWPMLDTIKTPEQAASDHAAIWADVALP
jgi:hypothetical protein